LQANKEAVTGVEEDELVQVNSEMRYLTLELMKVATKRKARFKDVLNEFIQNTYALKHAIRNSTFRKAKRRAKRQIRADSAAGKGPSQG